MCQNKLPVKIKNFVTPGGRISPIYEYVPCRKCEECISIRKSQWCFRAIQETEHSFDSIFLTLTYDDEHMPKDQSVSVRDIQLFFKRMRKNARLWYPDFDYDQYPLKYFLVSEYGSQRGRPHYHLILWNSPLNWYEIEKTWKNGFIKIGNTTPKSVQYCLKYFAIKEKAPKGRQPNFCVMSKNIGKKWLSDNLYYAKSYVCLPGSSAKIPIPKYYSDRLPFYYCKNQYNKKHPYDWTYEPEPYNKFSRKYLRTRGLLGKHSLVARLVATNEPVGGYHLDIYQDSYSYYLYRDEIFHRKYDKCNNKDNQ